MGKVLRARRGNSVSMLLSRLTELRVSVTPSNTRGSKLWMALRSRFRAVIEFMFSKSPDSRSLILFWATSKKAKPWRILAGSGMVLSWQPFRFRFLREVSRPRKQFGEKVTSLPLNLRVLSRRVTNALSGRNLIWLLERSSWLISRSCLKAGTGRLRSSLLAKFKLCRVFSRPRREYFKGNNESEVAFLDLDHTIEVVP